MSAISGLGCIFGLALVCYGLGHSFGGLSPIGDIISPSRGFWRHQTADKKDLLPRLQGALKEAGLQPVEIEIDSNEVPHLKSESDSSVYFAQGFVTAYYRLWQMDFLSRVSAGEVSEILGEKAVPIDRFFRRLRLPSAARASSELMMTDPVTRGPLAAYTRGVNARIAQIDITSIPIEYRLFGVLPEAWSEDRAAHLLKFMTWQLTGYLYDMGMTASKAKLSQEIFDNLFPLGGSQPAAILEKRESPLAATVHRPSQGRQISRVRWTDVPQIALPEPENGSNSWAVPARLMNNRRALIANDLHLGYSLPSLWFSVQLTTPNMNVYGASLPGAPGVIVGFNETMGWSVTNGTDDVLDWYSLRFRDERRQEYMFEDSWRPIVIRDEVIRIAGGKTEVVKTRETHVGPIVFDEGDATGMIDIPSGLAIQWTGFIPSNELKSFLLLNRAESARDCLAALKSYVAPAQNFVCGDRSGRLVYKHAGVFPDRRGRDGRVIFEAAHDSDLWQGFLPAEENPSTETTNDLIVTANQRPFNGDGIQRYGWFFAPPFRALQIRSRLEGKKSWEPEQMVSLQADTSSWLAENFKRIVLRESQASPLREALKTAACENRVSNESLERIIQNWKGEHSANDQTAPLLHRWMVSLEEMTWTRLIGPRGPTHWPARWRLFELIEHEPNASIWDSPATSHVENLNTQLAVSLGNACDVLKEKFGSGSLPTWASYQATVHPHAGRIPGLGRDVQVGGEADSIFANKGDHGPTWKMIVTFEDVPRAWTMIPGGQNGDPSSLQYDDHLEAWSKGKMNPVQFNVRKVSKDDQHMTWKRVRK